MIDEPPVQTTKKQEPSVRWVVSGNFTGCYGTKECFSTKEPSQRVVGNFSFAISCTEGEFADNHRRLALAALYAWALRPRSGTCNLIVTDEGAFKVVAWRPMTDSEPTFQERVEHARAVC